MTTILSDNRAIEILKQHCDPERYPTEEEMLCGLTDTLDRETIASLRAFLGNVIDDDSMPASQKAKKYFSLSISNEEKAEHSLTKYIAAFPNIFLRMKSNDLKFR